jgi:CheY-like chemotaxis protein
MKVILLTHPGKNYEKPITQWIESAIKQSRNQQEGEPLLTLKSTADFKRIKSFREFFSDDSSTNFVVIVPELGWEDGGSFSTGYERALELLGDLLGDRFFQLVFVSFFQRKHLWEMVSSNYRELVKSFSHLTLSELSQNPLQKYTYTRLHFELLRRVAVSKTGHLSYIRHDLARYKQLKAKEASEEIKHVLEVLSLPVYLDVFEDQNYADSMLRGFRSERERLTDAGVLSLVNRIGFFIDEIQDRLNSQTETKTKASYKVLIVEDDPFYSRELQRLFLRYFEKVDVFDVEKISQAKSLMFDKSRKYDLILLDLMFYEAGKAGLALCPFNGLDLYKEIRRADRWAGRKTAVRVITAVPRNDFFHITEKFIGSEDAPGIFTKGDGPEQLKGCLLDRMDDMIAECRDNEQRKPDLEQRPRVGIFVTKGATQVYQDVVAMKEAFDCADNVVAGKGNIKIDPTLPSTKTFSEKTLRKYLPQLVTHRRLVIEFVKKHPNYDFKSGWEDFNLYMRKFFQKEVDFGGVSYFTSQLGFNKQEGKSTIILDLNPMNMFPEECVSFGQRQEQTLFGVVREWAVAVLTGVLDITPTKGEQLSLDHIFGEELVNFIYNLDEDDSRPVTVSRLISFFEKSADVTDGLKGSETDKFYIEDYLQNSEIALDEPDNKEVKELILSLYPELYEKYKRLIEIE